MLTFLDQIHAVPKRSEHGGSLMLPYPPDGFTCGEAVGLLPKGHSLNRLGLGRLGRLKPQPRCREELLLEELLELLELLRLLLRLLLELPELLDLRDHHPSLPVTKQNANKTTHTILKSTFILHSA